MNKPEDIVLSVCANCGKGEEESGDLKKCNACKLVKYCSRDCQIAHRSQHKKACRKRAAELHDEQLFKQPPPADDCPICFIRMPTLETGSKYMTCCGKVVCNGCIYAPVYDNEGNEVDDDICPFCRAPPPTSNEERFKRKMKRVEVNDVHAMYSLGCYYAAGKTGLSQNYTKALELLHRAAELGHAPAHASIGYFYEVGEGVEIDRKKVKYHYELAAIGGYAGARYNLGNNEHRAGNFDRALKHHMIAAKNGISESLNMIKKMYLKGLATKEDYTKALRTLQDYLGEIKSKQRDEAAAYSDRYRYY